MEPVAFQRTAFLWSPPSPQGIANKASNVGILAIDYYVIPTLFCAHSGMCMCMRDISLDA